ncbi:glycosyltransferase [Pontibacter populi]|uniref:Glycosyltransferase n=1 Tax=Pontibacter populi TaxID=890055 RepID=A0ABV1RVW1_9BACT
MRILHIIPNLGSGGAERFVVDLVNTMSIKHEVHLCTLYDLNKDKNDFFLNEVNTRIKLHSLGKKIGLDIKIFLRLYEIIKDIKPDIVHTHMASINYTLLSALIYKVPLYVHTVHNDAFREVKHWSELLTRKLFYKNSLIHTITISNTSARSFYEAYGFQSSARIYNGRQSPEKTENYNIVFDEVEKLKRSCNTLVLVSVGRLVGAKNQVMLSKVVAKLRFEGYDIILLIIGGDYGVESENIKLQISQIGCKDIHILGTRKNVIDYLNVADAFCLSSLFEGLPISLLEAMSQGCIPVCTPVGGIPDIIIDKESGFIAKDITEDEYYIALKHFLNSTNKSEIKKNVIKIFNKQFEISSTVENYLTFYEQKK